MCFCCVEVRLISTKRCLQEKSKSFSFMHFGLWNQPVDRLYLYQITDNNKNILDQIIAVIWLLCYQIFHLVHSDVEAETVFQEDETTWPSHRRGLSWFSDWNKGTHPVHPETESSALMERPVETPINTISPTLLRHRRSLESERLIKHTKGKADYLLLWRLQL